MRPNRQIGSVAAHTTMTELPDSPKAAIVNSQSQQLQHSWSLTDPSELSTVLSELSTRWKE